VNFAHGMNSIFLARAQKQRKLPLAKSREIAVNSYRGQIISAGIARRKKSGEILLMRSPGAQRLICSELGSSPIAGHLHSRLGLLGRPVRLDLRRNGSWNGFPLGLGSLAEVPALNPLSLELGPQDDAGSQQELEVRNHRVGYASSLRANRDGRFSHPLTQRRAGLVNRSQTNRLDARAATGHRRTPSTSCEGGDEEARTLNPRLVKRFSAQREHRNSREKQRFPGPSIIQIAPFTPDLVQIVQAVRMALG
jgi:hypothetical protein